MRPLQVPVLYPFGHGLSYTSFAYQQMTAAVPAGASSSVTGGSGGGGGCAAQAAPLLQLAVSIANVGSMAADEVALLLLSFAGERQQRQQRLRHWWRWPLQREAPGGHIRLDLPCTSSSDGSGQPEGLPVQTLVGFERLRLVPGKTAAVNFNLTASHFVPFSPLAEGSRCGGNRGVAAGGCRQAARPHCGVYLLRSGSQQLVVRLGGSTGLGGTTAQK